MPFSRTISMRDPLAVRVRRQREVSKRSAAFYTDLFGWRIDGDNPLAYRQIDTGDSSGIQPAPA
jgi:hypothetical protein